jgi:hypothetical protein
LDVFFFFVVGREEEEEDDDDDVEVREESGFQRMSATRAKPADHNEASMTTTIITF